MDHRAWTAGLVLFVLLGSSVLGIFLLRCSDDFVSTAIRASGSLAQHLREIDIIYGQHFSDHVVNAIVENGPHLVQLLQQAVQNPPFDNRLTLFRIAGYEIERVHITLLANAVDAPQPLLQARRIPRQVVVDHQSAELEVDAFACRFRGYTDLLLSPELLLSTLTFMRVHAAVNLAGRKTPALKVVAEVVESVAVLRKEEQFAPTVCQFSEFHAIEALSESR